MGGDTCTIRTVTGDEYTFQSPNAEDIKELVASFLEGLKLRSRYLIAIQSQKGDGEEARQREDRAISETLGFLEFERGDLLTMTHHHTGKDLLTEVVVKVRRERTRQFDV